MILKKFKFLNPDAWVWYGWQTQARGSGMVTRPRHLGLDPSAFDLANHARPKVRESNNYYLSTHVTPCERGHDCASSETADDQIWPLGNVTMPP